ncbi:MULTISPECIES: hypothetical protein [unclassified Clostridioides]|uniref:hypothetical protein n=1 Tax=unclassified Clostridioides TaxID=2635829 RepID=UPI001D107077|nr:hypothetical protein [Clostridioides sp. ES-S-0048-02]MCC0704909.1 hypothetical protein [Clostridioides sp. ES-S-0049-02]
MLDLLKKLIIEELIKSNIKMDILDTKEFEKEVKELDIGILMRLYEPMVHLHCMRNGNKELEKMKVEDFLRNAGADIEEK